MPHDREPTFVPFADDATVLTMGDFNVENGTGRIALFGSLDLTCDARGLRHARALRDLMDAVVRRIESTGIASAGAPSRGPADAPGPSGKKP